MSSRTTAAAALRVSICTMSRGENIRASGRSSSASDSRGKKRVSVP
jgi:hypothetical protein